MLRFPAILPLLLMAAVAANAVSAAKLVTASQLQKHPSGCHEQGNTSPHPSNYQCCQAGHNLAVVQAGLWLPVTASESINHAVQEPLLMRASSPFLRSLSTSASPPGLLPLRI